MKTPDIEIYVKNILIEDLIHWLNLHFQEVSLPAHCEQLLNKGKTIRATVSHDLSATDLIITPQAAGKSFTSLWFKQNTTPWLNDEACGLSLLETADCEVRCSASGWQETEDLESEEWLLLTRNEKKKIRWS